MMCYRDMTFCTESNCRDWETCPQAYTTEIEKNAKLWWGSEEPPIAVFMGQPECYNNDEQV